MTRALVRRAAALAAVSGLLAAGGPRHAGAAEPQDAAAPGRAAPAAIPGQSAPAAGEHLVVSLVTMGPGPNIWDRFGHTAIWIADTLAGTSEAYNYGLFDFNQEDFLLRFLRGDMWYWMAPFPAESYIGSYIRADRSVWVQELDLDPLQRAALRDFLEWNALPENRFYGYDYYRDNCSTRVRDALDRVLGGAIRAATDTVATGTTYRSHTRRLVAPAPLAYTGIHLALGQPTDEALSLWEAMFVPMEMQRALRDVRVTTAAGRSRPLVRAEYTLHASRTFSERAEPPVWWPAYLAVGAGVGGALALGGRARRRGARRGFAVLAAVWCGIVGAAGVIITALWALTDHAAAYRNENLLQANLLILPLAFLAPRLAAGALWAGRPARLLAGAVLGLSLAGCAVQLVPGFDQVNGGPIALLLPAHLGLWLGVRALARDPEGQREIVSPSAAASTTSPGAAPAA